MTERFDAAQEKNFINGLYAHYRVGDDAPQTQAMRGLVFQTFRPFIDRGLGLELGCSDGYMTELLASRVDMLHVVDGSDHFVAEARKRALPNAEFHCSLFEEFRPEPKYDYVFASYILEHVFDTQPVLAMARGALRPGGRLFVVVPNARALSRQLALHMGLVSNLYDLTPADLENGHRRVYDRAHLNRDLAAAGFSVIHQGGVMLKILADFQMDQLIASGFLKSEHLQGLYALGLEYPDFAGSLFAMCEARSEA